MKKFFAILLALVMVLGLAACGSQEAPAADDGAKVFKIGACQLIQHPALDAATQGFQDAIVEALGADAVEFDIQVASGDFTTCSTVVNGLISEGCDLILANATAALQAAASATSDIPVLGTSITDYATALEIDNWTGTVGGNVSGTSDLAPLSEQAAMIKEWFPEAQNVGLVFCSAEPNSKYQVTVVAEELAKMGINTTEFAFTDSNDISAVVTAACAASDVIYVPTDNTAANNTESIANIVEPAGIPVIAGEEGICSGCGVATLSISYYDLGVATGKMAVKILQGADVSTMPVEFAPQVTKKYNAAMVEKLGIEIPSDEYVVIE